MWRATSTQNRLTPAKGTPEWKLFLRQFLNMFAVLLTVAGCLSMATFIELVAVFVYGLTFHQ
jgi:hypothetical protein